MPRPLLMAFLTVAALAALPQGALAQQAVLATNGSTLAAAPNLALPSGANQCQARPYIGLDAGQITFLNTNQTSCMWWSTEYGPDGAVIANTYVPRGAGAVTKVRVRSGDSPAPLRFAILGSGSGLCCTTRQVSAQVQPAADQVNEFAMNLPAGSGVGDTDGSQYNDILVVVATGPGSLPVNDRGAHGFLLGSTAGQARARFLHPALTLGESNTDVGIMDGYEVLLQYDWCGVPMTGANRRPVAPPDPQTACAGQAPSAAPPGTAPATPTAGGGASPLRFVAALAAVLDGAARLRLACVLTTACTGTVLLRPRSGGAATSAAAPKSYGSARFRIAAKRSTTLKLRLSNAGRSALRRRSRVRADAVVTSGGTTSVLKLTLKRG